MLASVQAQIPEPLGQDLKTLLSTGGMRHPTIGVLLAIFISEDRLKRAAMRDARSSTSLALKAGEGNVETNNS
jgi:hypothetical protein